MGKQDRMLVLTNATSFDISNYYSDLKVPGPLNFIEFDRSLILYVKMNQDASLAAYASKAKNPLGPED